MTAVTGKKRVPADGQGTRELGVHQQVMDLKAEAGAVLGCVWMGPSSFWIILPSGVQYVKRAGE